ncbi:MAG: hypothetical protein Alis3KO_29220 [Aliiglaciecola sp.]
MKVAEKPLECLCPHCLKPNQISYGHAKKLNTTSSMYCKICFESFEFVIANGVENAKNVIVLV